MFEIRNVTSGNKRHRLSIGPGHVTYFEREHNEQFLTFAKFVGKNFQPIGNKIYRGIFNFNLDGQLRIRLSPEDNSENIIFTEGAKTPVRFKTPDYTFPCPNCGRMGDITLHHVVPLEIAEHIIETQFGPDSLSRDEYEFVVPLCRACHTIYEGQHALKLKRKYAEQYGLSLNEWEFIDKIVRLSKTVHGGYGNKIPEERLKKLRAELVQRTSPKIDNSDIEFFCAHQMGSQITGSSFQSFGCRLANVIMKEHKVNEFVRTWRIDFKNFLRQESYPIRYWDQMPRSFLASQRAGVIPR